MRMSTVLLGGALFGVGYKLGGALIREVYMAKAVRENNKYYYQNH